MIRRTPYILASALLSVLTACSSTSPSTSAATPPAAAPLRKVTLVLDWTPNTNHSGIYLAKAKGLYKKAGLDVTVIEPGPDGGLPQLAAGNAQFAISVSESLLPARAQGAKVVSVAAVLAHNTSSLVVPADRGVNSAKELAGKTYGGFGGDLEKALVQKLVTCDGGDASTVKYVEIGNVDYNVGLQRKDYDAVWVFDGWDVIRLQDLGGMKLQRFPFHPSCVPDWYTPVLVTSEAMIAKDPDVVRAFVGATAAGYELSRTDPKAAAAALLAAAPELDAKLVKASAEYLASRYGDKGQPWGRQDVKVWTDFTKFLRTAKLLSADVDPKKVFTNDFLP